MEHGWNSNSRSKGTQNDNLLAVPDSLKTAMGRLVPINSLFAWLDRMDEMPLPTLESSSVVSD